MADDRDDSGAPPPGAFRRAVADCALRSRGHAEALRDLRKRALQLRKRNPEAFEIMGSLSIKQAYGLRSLMPGAPGRPRRAMIAELNRRVDAGERPTAVARELLGNNDKKAIATLTREARRQRRGQK